MRMWYMLYKVYLPLLENVYCFFMPVELSKIQRRPSVDIFCTYINTPLNNTQQESVVATLSAKMCEILAARIDDAYRGLVFHRPSV